MLPYRRHPNGSGKLVKEEVYVSRHSIIDSASVIIGDSCVFKSKVYGSVIKDCIVSESELHNVSLSQVTVEDAKLFGLWSLDGPYYIREGVWTRPPRAMTLQDDSGIYVGLTESVDGRAFIACNERSVDDWLKCGLRIGRHLQWPEELCQRAYQFMEELRDCPLAINDWGLPHEWLREIPQAY